MQARDAAQNANYKVKPTLHEVFPFRTRDLKRQKLKSAGKSAILFIVELLKIL
jgi:hypothetical protein